MRSGRCSSWRVSLFCSPRSVIPQSWLHLPPKTPLRYSLTLIIFLVGVSHHLEFCSPAVAHAVTVCHIFCNSLSMLANCRFRSVFSFILFHYTPSLIPQRQPHARAVIHSLISFHFATITFRGLCFFPRYYQCGCSIVPFHSTKLHHRTHKPLIVLFRYTPLHSLITSSPCFSNAFVRSKKCAKLAAGSTQPPRVALPVSGAFAPLAAARTQRTGLILRSVSLLSHVSLAINAGSRLFLPRKFGLNLLLPRQPPTTHPQYKCS